MLTVMVTVLPLSARAVATEAQEQSGPGHPTCSHCRIEVQEVTVVGSFDDPELLGERVPAVTRLSDGRIVAGAAAAIVVYGPDGRFRRTLVAKEGPGPGELSRVRRIEALANDTLAVVQTGSLDFFTPDGEWVRSRRYPFSSHSALHIAPDGDILFSGWLSGPTTAGYRFHMLNQFLEPIRSFGEVPPPEQIECGRCRIRPSTWSRSKPGHFWSIPPNEYRIELWHGAGNLREVLRIEDSPWFEEWASDRQSDQSRTGIEIGRTRAAERPLPYIHDIEEDESGLLWITAYVPTSDWRPFPSGVPTSVRPPIPDDLRTYLDRQMDTIIEVIDPATGEVVARTRIAHERLAPIGVRTYKNQFQEASGLMRVRILEARLLGRS